MKMDTIAIVIAEVPAYLCLGAGTFLDARCNNTE